MSCASVIVRTLQGVLKLLRSPTRPKYPSHRDGKLRHIKIATLENPRFTKEQLERLNLPLGRPTRSIIPVRTELDGGGQSIRTWGSTMLP